MSTLQAFPLVLVAFILFINSPASVDGSYKKTELTVGYLTAIKGELKDRQGLAISGAISIAIGEFPMSFINYILADYILRFDISRRNQQ